MKLLPQRKPNDVPSYALLEMQDISTKITRRRMEIQIDRGNADAIESIVREGVKKAIRPDMRAKRADIVVVFIWHDRDNEVVPPMRAMYVRNSVPKALRPIPWCGRYGTTEFAAYGGRIRIAMEVKE